MVKIKTKKTMNLPQLIDWGFERGAHGVQFTSDRGKRVGFRHMGYFWTECEIDKEETFTLEFEDEITEDTVIPEMLTIYDEGISHLTNNKSLNDLIKDNLKSAYTMNDDLRLILIWRDGRLVE